MGEEVLSIKGSIGSVGVLVHTLWGGAKVRPILMIGHLLLYGTSDKEDLGRELQENTNSSGLLTEVLPKKNKLRYTVMH